MLSKHHDNSNFEEKTVTYHMGEINTPTKKKLIQNENTKTLLGVFEVKKIVYYSSLQWAGGTPTVPWAIPYQPSMVCHKYSRSEMHLLNETRFHAYWKKNLSSARRREDQMMTNFVKHHWWLKGHHPWDCWSPSSPLEWVVKRFFSTPWQNKIGKCRKFKSYFTY